MAKQYVTLRLTRTVIASHKACQQGLELFDAIAPSGLLELEWTPLAMVWLAVAQPQFAEWLYHAGLIPWSLRDADLSGLDLRSAWLHGAKLEGALRGATGYPHP